MKRTVVQTENKIYNPIFTDQFIDLQLRDFELRKAEHEAKKTQNARILDFAKSTYVIQTEESKSMRENESKRDKYFLNIVMVVIILFCSLMIVAMLLNKDVLLIEMSKVAGYIFGGGITGYGLALQKTNKKEKDPSGGEALKQ